MTQFNKSNDKIQPASKSKVPDRSPLNVNDEDQDLNRPYGDAQPEDVERQRSDDLSRRRQSSL